MENEKNNILVDIDGDFILTYQNENIRKEINKKIIVWDFFGGGMNSVKKALDNKIYEIYTFDILNTFKDTIILDMSKSNVMEFLKQFPKPDIVIGSPPCMSFSRAAAMKGEGSGNATWKYNSENLLIKREKWEYEGTRYIYEKQQEKARIGTMCIVNLINIIKYYKPKNWYIENPATSLIWDFIKYNLRFNEGEHNITYYGLYGEEYKKPTNFMSNKILTLKKQINKEFKSFEAISKLGIERSRIPKELIRDIFKSFEKEGEQRQMEIGDLLL